MAINVLNTSSPAIVVSHEHTHAHEGVCNHGHDSETQPTVAVLLPDDGSLPSDHEGHIYCKETCGAVGDHKALGYNNVFVEGMQATQDWFEKSGLSLPSPKLGSVEEQTLKSIKNGMHNYVDADRNQELAGKIKASSVNDKKLAALCQQRNTAENIVQKHTKALLNSLSLNSETYRGKTFSWVDLSPGFLDKISSANQSVKTEDFCYQLQQEGLQVNTKLKHKKRQTLVSNYQTQKTALQAAATAFAGNVQAEQASVNDSHLQVCKQIYSNLLRFQEKDQDLNSVQNYLTYVKEVLAEVPGFDLDCLPAQGDIDLGSLIEQFKRILDENIVNQQEQIKERNKEILDIKSKIFEGKKSFRDFFSNKFGTYNSNTGEFFEELKFNGFKSNINTWLQNKEIDLGAAFDNLIKSFLDGVNENTVVEKALDDIDEKINTAIKNRFASIGSNNEDRPSNKTLQETYSQAQSDFDASLQQLLAYITVPGYKIEKQQEANSQEWSATRQNKSSTAYAFDPKKSIFQECLDTTLGLVAAHSTLEQDALALDKAVSINSDSLFLCPGKVKEGEAVKSAKARHFSLHQPYGYYRDTDGTEYSCCYRLDRVDNGDYKIFVYRNDGTHFTDADGIDLPEIEINSIEDLQHYLGVANVDALLGGGDFTDANAIQAYLKTQTFESVYARYQQGVNAYKKARDIVCKPIMAALEKAIKELDVSSVVGTGFSYNAALYGENDAVNHRAVVAGLLFDLALRGKIALHGSCGFQQNLVWWLRQPIIAVQDITGLLFLASPHGNDHNTVEDDATIQKIVPFTVRAGLHESVTVRSIKNHFTNNKIIANRLSNSLVRDVKPLSIVVPVTRELLANEGALVEGPDGKLAYNQPISITSEKSLEIVTPDGQTMLGHEQLQLDEVSLKLVNAALDKKTSLENGTLLTLEHNIPNGLFDPQGDEFLVDGERVTQRTKIQVAYDAQRNRFVLVKAEHWELVPLADEKDPHAAQIVDKDNSQQETVQCTYQRIEVDAPFVENKNSEPLIKTPISPMLLVDHAYSRINCVHTQNGYGELLDPGLSNGQFQAVGVSFVPNDVPFVTAHILGGTIDAPGSFPIALLNGKQQSAILESMEGGAGHGINATFNQHHSDMMQREGGGKHHPYKKTPANALGDVKDPYKGHREGNREVVATGKHLKQVGMLFEELGDYTKDLQDYSKLSATDPSLLEETRRPLFNKLKLKKASSGQALQNTNSVSDVNVDGLKNIRLELSQFKYKLRKIDIENFSEKDLNNFSEKIKNIQFNYEILLPALHDLNEDSDIQKLKHQTANELKTCRLFLHAALLLKELNQPKETQYSNAQQGYFFGRRDEINDGFKLYEPCHFDVKMGKPLAKELDEDYKHIANLLDQINRKLSQPKTPLEDNASSSSESRIGVAEHINPINQASGSRSWSTANSNSEVSNPESSSAAGSVNSSKPPVLSTIYTEFQVFELLVKGVVSKIEVNSNDGTEESNGASISQDSKIFEEIKNVKLGDELPRVILDLNLPIAHEPLLKMVCVLQKALTSFKAEDLSKLLVNKNGPGGLPAWEPFAQQLLHHYIHEARTQELQTIFPDASNTAAADTEQTQDTTTARFQLPGDTCREFVSRNASMRGFFSNVFKTPVWLRASVGMGGPLGTASVWVATTFAGASAAVCGFIAAGFGLAFSSLLNIMGVQLWREAGKKIKRLNPLLAQQQGLAQQLEARVLDVINSSRNDHEKYTSIEQIPGFGKKRSNETESEQTKLLSSLQGSLGTAGVLSGDIPNVNKILEYSIDLAQTQKAQVTLLKRDLGIQGNNKKIGVLFSLSGLSGMVASGLAVAKTVAVTTSFASLGATISGVAGAVAGGLLTFSGLVAIYNTSKQLRDAKLERDHIALGNCLDSGVGRAGAGFHVQRIADLKWQLAKWIGFTGSSAALTVMGVLALCGIIGATSAATFGAVPAVLLAGFVVALYVQHRRERNGKALVAPENTMHTQGYNIATDALKNRVVNRGNFVMGNLGRFARHIYRQLAQDNPKFENNFNRKFYGVNPNGWGYRLLSKIGAGGLGASGLSFGRKWRSNGDYAAANLHSQEIAKATKRDHVGVRGNQVELMLRVVDIENNVLQHRIGKMREIIKLRSDVNLRSENPENSDGPLNALLKLTDDVTQEALMREELRLLEVQSLQQSIRLFSATNGHRLFETEKTSFDCLRWRYLLLTEGLQDSLEPVQVRALLELQNTESNPQTFVRVWYNGQMHTNLEGVPKSAKHQRVEFVWGQTTADFLFKNMSECIDIDRVFVNDALMHAPGRESMRMAAVLNTFLQQRLMNLPSLERMVKAKDENTAKAKKTAAKVVGQASALSHTHREVSPNPSSKPQLNPKFVENAWKFPMRQTTTPQAA